MILKIRILLIFFICINIGCSMARMISKPMPNEIEQQFEQTKKAKLTYLRANFLGKDKSEIYKEMGKPKEIKKNVWFCKKAAPGYAGCFYSKKDNKSNGEIGFYDEVLYYEDTEILRRWIQYSDYQFKIINSKIVAIN